MRATRHGQTALMLAAAAGNGDVVDWLTGHGAALDHTAKFGLSALMLAVVRGHTGIVRKLAGRGLLARTVRNGSAWICGQDSPGLGHSPGRRGEYWDSALGRPKRVRGRAMMGIIRFALFALLTAAALPAAVRLYPVSEGLTPAPDFDVLVNGKPVFVHDSPVAPFIHFSMSGGAEVTVKVRSGVRYTAAQEYEAWGRRYQPRHVALPLGAVEVRPHSAGITPVVCATTRSVSRLARPANLSIEFGGNLTRPLFVFAAPEETDAPAAPAPGVRYFAPGKVYDVGRLELASGETVYIAGGAVVRGTILAADAEGARIRGRGVLDGSDETKAEGPMIELRRCRDVRVEGIVILNNRGWTVIPRHSRGVVFDNIKMIAWNNNSDGIDVVGSRGRRHPLELLPQQRRLDPDQGRGRRQRCRAASAGKPRSFETGRRERARQRMRLLEGGRRQRIRDRFRVAHHFHPQRRPAEQRHHPRRRRRRVQHSQRRLGRGERH